MGRAHIPRLRTVRGASKLATYSMCIMDGKRVSNEFFVDIIVILASCYLLLLILEIDIVLY